MADATYYVDTTATGNDDGSSWTDAWTTLQRAIDGTDGITPQGTDTVLCYSNGETNKESPSATIDFDGLSGNVGSGYIKFVGCSTNTGDGSPDGTKYVIDGGGARDPIATMETDIMWIENFRFTNASGDGVDTYSAGNPDWWVWINCEFDNNGGDGWTCDTSTADYHLFVGCRFHNNTGDGIGLGAFYGWYMNCAFYQNGGHGFWTNAAYTRAIRCAYFDNGDSNTNATTGGTDFWDSCVFDGTNQSSETNFSIGGDRVFLFASRITNAATGINAYSNLSVAGWCLFDNNTSDTSSDTLLYHLPFESDLDLASSKGVFSEGNPTGSTNKFDPDADDGYNAASSQDYNLKASRTYNGDGTDTVELGVGS